MLDTKNASKIQVLKDEISFCQSRLDVLMETIRESKKRDNMSTAIAQVVQAYNNKMRASIKLDKILCNHPVKEEE